MRTVAVVLAGGVGSRLGLDVPKQMVKIAGKTILEHTVEALHGSDVVDEIVLMMTTGWTEHTATLLGTRYPKLTRILEGGSTRNETTRKVLVWALWLAAGFLILLGTLVVFTFDPCLGVENSTTDWLIELCSAR